MSDNILEACMQYQNYPIKTDGEEAFYIYYIIHHYLKISKIVWASKSTTQVSDIILDACINFES